MAPSVRSAHSGVGGLADLGVGDRLDRPQDESLGSSAPCRQDDDGGRAVLVWETAGRPVWHGWSVAVDRARRSVERDRRVDPVLGLRNLRRALGAQPDRGPRGGGEGDAEVLQGQVAGLEQDEPSGGRSVLGRALGRGLPEVLEGPDEDARARIHAGRLQSGDGPHDLHVHALLPQHLDQGPRPGPPGAVGIGHLPRPVGAAGQEGEQGKGNHSRDDEDGCHTQRATPSARHRSGHGGQVGRGHELTRACSRNGRAAANRPSRSPTNCATVASTRASP